MKKFLAFLLAFLFLFNVAAFAYQRVRGYTRRNGTYVAPHYRSDPDGIRSNNWSSSGNVNPFTGKRGYRDY
jgi:hypothetical protein